MNYVSQLDAHANWLESEADAADARAERQAECLSQDWDDCIKERNLDANIGGGYFQDLIEVLGEACSQGDQTINRALMQALVDLAVKGHPEAVQALDLVKDFFIEQTMERK
jgi:hypothetical protein